MRDLQTPTATHLDALGRAFWAVTPNKIHGLDAPSYQTRSKLDVQGNVLRVVDARGVEAAIEQFDVLGRRFSTTSPDSGARLDVVDIGNKPVRSYNGRRQNRRYVYDVLQRPTCVWLFLDGEPERLVKRVVHGEAHPEALQRNLRGQAYQVYDGAGVVTSQAYDFKGNLLQASRRLRSEVHAGADWSVLSAPTDVSAIAAAADPLLEAESFETQTEYDALNRPTSLNAPDASEIKPTYNEAGLLERVEVRIRGAAGWTTFVDNIDYDAKGQRERIDYGNGTSTVYTYDPLTFRLSRLKTTRSSDSAVLQNLTYVYDPVGNIVEIGDSAQQTVFFNDDVVSPSAQYVYDAVYRLIEATGREHAGGLADVQRDQNDLPIQALPHANDVQALRNYTEQYVYDEVGNLLRMVHQAGAGTWTRRYAYEAASNRLTSTSVPGDPVNGPYSATYAHDAHGNMTAMPHIAQLTWDENDQVRSTNLGGGGVVYSTYDAAGQRVRKVWEHSGLVEERIYLGGYEVYRRRNSSGLELERQTLHVMDGARRVAMVETKTVDTSGPFTVTPRVRYQLDNHLGSASLEVDGAGLVIGYEEYHPYGTTAYWSAASGIEVSQRRYRYTGKEKDEETGLYYHGARYYAPWLGRWTSSDPAGMVDGPNLFAYCGNSPIAFRDPRGTQKAPLEIRTSERPSESLSMWALIPGQKGPTTARSAAELRAAAGKAGVPIFVYDPSAPGSKQATTDALLGGISILKPGDGATKGPGGGEQKPEKTASQVLAHLDDKLSLGESESAVGGSEWGVHGGANPNARSDEGKQALFAAVSLGAAAVDFVGLAGLAKALLKKGIDKLGAKLGRDTIGDAVAEGIEQGAKEAVDEAAKSVAKNGLDDVAASAVNAGEVSTTRLWRTVEAEELAELRQFGDYNLHPNSTFKRFAFSEADVDAFMKANPN
ncbi:RHS repeat-associated core domain-containing protein [Sorangium sp. So ce1024]|uniref:RHS repeat domain-containing protein n=1 Tax=Sorangium sp. So ce1024 TaxID=3133327 RepID=UPI003F11E865